MSGEQAAVATAAFADPQTDLIGRLREATLGEYDILGELGRGGMATVFLAHDIALDRRVAVKVMSPTLTTASTVERFKREARTAASLSHPHIIPIYAVRETRNLLFFVMKFIEGRALDRIIREQGALPIPMIQAILGQVGDALAYAHRRGIIHRDVKPANIMLDQEGFAVVTDFGIAKVPDAQVLTMTGVTVGTPSYMSPEQGMGVKEISSASDQYSLGVVAYEMLTGRVPFEADSLMAIMWQHFNAPPPAPLERRPDCPPALADAITRMLAKTPAGRFATLQDAVAAIGEPPHDDPIHEHMRRLSRGSAGTESAAQFHTPASPVPASPSADQSVSPDALTLPSAPFPAPRPSQQPAAPAQPGLTRRRLPLLIGAAGLVAVAAIAWVLTHRGAPAGEPEAPVPPPAALPPPPANVASIVMAPPRAISIAVGGSVQLHAIPLDSAGAPLGGRAIAWRSADSTVARVSAAGLVTGGATGRAAIVATIEGHEGRVTVTVTTGRAPVASVSIQPAALDLSVGGTATLQAAPRDRAGAALGDRQVAWSTDRADVVRVSAAGTEGGGSATLTALTEGVAQITAAVEGRRTTARVTVSPPAVATVAVTPAASRLKVGESVPLAATTKDASGAVLAGRLVSWTSSNDAVAAVTQGGVVTAKHAGDARITATSSKGKSGSATISVTAPPPPSAPVVAPTPVPPSEPAPARGGLVLRAGTLAAGAQHTCGVADAGTTVCWGANAAGQLGAPPQAKVATPVAAAAPSGLTALVSGAAHTCGLKAGVALCWGSNTHGQLGAGPVDDKKPVTTPVTVAGSRRYVALAAGAAHTCGIAADSTAWCWGNNSDGQLGDGSRKSSGLPVGVHGNLKFRDIAAGEKHTCAVTGAGKVYCWGDGFSLQLGRGIEEQWSEPVAADVKLPIVTLAARKSYTCALARDGGVICWGGSRRPPEKLDTKLQFTVLAAGDGFACGLTGSGEAWCWGRNRDGQLGDSTRTDRKTPVRARTLVRLASLAAGDAHVCALTEGRQTLCWGANASGQLGSGAFTAQAVPALVEPTRRP